MTDRELLELAAKASGIKATCWIDKTHEWFQQEGVGHDDSNDCQQLWNPLTDDGDAFRLLVKLNLIYPLTRLQHFLTIERFSRQGDNDDVATRRAIVRCAAEIGKSIT